MRRTALSAFSLVELSIVILIIGLLLGAIVVGQEIVRNAGIRATVAQINEYNQAVNAFEAKYGGLPGDLLDSISTANGLPFVGSNGNGVLDASSGTRAGVVQGAGEPAMFWQHLARTHLIAGDFSGPQRDTWFRGYNITLSSSPYTLNDFMPQAKLGRGNYVYAYSGGYYGTVNGVYGWNTDNTNYFAISLVTGLGSGVGLPNIAAAVGISPLEASSIDSKIDDGYPQTGDVTARYLNGYAQNPQWAGDSPGAATTQTATTCYDNSHNAALPETYSMGSTAAGGKNYSCALSFKFK